MGTGTIKQRDRHPIENCAHARFPDIDGNDLVVVDTNVARAVDETWGRNATAPEIALRGRC